MPVDKVDFAGDAVELRLPDDLDELVDAAVGVDVLDVTLVLPDQPVQRVRVQPDGVVDVAGVLVQRAEVCAGDDRGHLLLPLADGLPGLHGVVVLGVGRVGEAEVALDRLRDEQEEEKTG